MLYVAEKQPHVKEESLTDWILYTISERTNKFYYKAFSRNEEAANGADWEWWVLVNDYRGFCGYRFLVQAKKLKQAQDNYPLIAYGNKNGLQIDLLIDSAKHRNAMPIYIYYSTAVPEIIQQINNFSFIDKDIVSWCETCINGVYMSMAQSVKKKTFDSPRKKITEVDLLNNSLGFSMCDYLFHGKYSPKEIMDSINRYYVNIIEDDVLTASNDRKWFRIICFLIATKAPISATGCGVNRPLIQEDRKNRRTLHKRKKATVLQRYYRL